MLGLSVCVLDRVQSQMGRTHVFDFAEHIRLIGLSGALLALQVSHYALRAVVIVVYIHELRHNCASRFVSSLEQGGLSSVVASVIICVPSLDRSVVVRIIPIVSILLVLLPIQIGRQLAIPCFTTLVVVPLWFDSLLLRVLLLLVIQLLESVFVEVDWAASLVRGSALLLEHLANVGYLVGLG
jgi:hypothetical protein